MINRLRACDINSTHEALRDMPRDSEFVLLTKETQDIIDVVRDFEKTNEKRFEVEVEEVKVIDIITIRRIK